MLWASEVALYLKRNGNRRKCRQTVSSDVFNSPPGNFFAISGITFDEAVASPQFKNIEIGTSSRLVLKDKDCPTKRVYIIDGVTPSSEYNKLVNTTKSNFHWLENFGEDKTGWYWRKSSGNIEFILKHVTNAFETVSTENVMEIADKVVVVAAEPGMGKSTLLDHLAIQTKTDCPQMWVITVQLNDYSDHLSNPNFFADIKANVKKIIEAAAGVNSTTSKFNARLFDHCYDVTGNMIVLLDGFDEITPTYTEQGIKLIKTLQESLILRVWVTTRTVWASLLQSTTTTLCFSIQSLSVAEQKSFLHKFWAHKQNGKVKALNVFIENVLELIHNSIDKNLNEFTGIPLQTRMVAEAFDPEQELPKQINGLELFGKFVETKIDIWLNEKLKIDSTRAGLSHDVPIMKKRLIEELMQLALLTLLSFEECSTMIDPQISQEKKEELREHVKQGDRNAGLVVSFTSESPQFIHRTFAEYFVARFLATPSRYNANRRFLESETFFSGSFKLVQYFFNRILASGKKLHEAVLQREYGSLSVDVNITEELNSRDEGGRTALHIAAALPDGRKAIEILLKAEADPNIVDSVLEWAPLNYAIRMNHTENIGPLLEVKKPSAEVNSIVPVTWELLRLAISGDYLKLLLHLFDNNITSTTGMYRLRPLAWIEGATSDGLTLLYVAAWYNAEKILRYLLDPGSRDCKLSQLECLDGKGRTPLQLAVVNRCMEATSLLEEAKANLLVRTEGC